MMKTGGSESTFCAQISDRSRYGNLVQAGTVGVGNPDAFALCRGADEFSEITHEAADGAGATALCAGSLVFGDCREPGRGTFDRARGSEAFSAVRVNVAVARRAG